MKATVCGTSYGVIITSPAWPFQPKERSIDIWGRRHLRYIKKERTAMYTELLTSGRLNTYLDDVNETGNETNAPYKANGGA